MFKVYHKISPTFTVDQESLIKFPEGYKLVAVVDTNDLERAYMLTNHIDTNWTENEGVIPFSNRERSSSVGDVFVDRNKVRFVCDSFGWNKF